MTTTKSSQEPRRPKRPPGGGPYQPVTVYVPVALWRRMARVRHLNWSMLAEAALERAVDKAEREGGRDAAAAR